jgi:hypothetical protein
LESLDVASLGPEEAGSLCCATAIRIGGALGFLADGAKLGDYYSRVDRGLRSMLLSYQGADLNSDAVADAFAASWHLGTVFPSGSQVALFFGAGLGVADFAIMASTAENKVEPLQAALGRALEAARLWPRSINEEIPLDLVGFESSCQANALMNLRSGGVPSLVECIEGQSRRYREIAESLRS